MKKRIPKSARETLEKMAKDPHWHDYTVCSKCKFLCESYAANNPVIKWQDRTIEKVVYRVPLGTKCLLVILTLGFLTSVYLIINQKPIDKPYPVYHTVYVPDQLCQPKLDECQADYHAQRATIKYLTKRQKESELP